MDIKSKIAILKELYKIHDEFVSGYKVACGKGCATCCTRNVTMTSLEALYIFSGLNSEQISPLLKNISDKSSLKRLQPSVTSNRFADLCMQGEDVPEDENDPSWGPCPIIDDESCTIYDVRPMGCRCLISRHNCGEAGFADMDDFAMTVNSVFVQYIEHIDSAGISGNFTDMMQYLSVAENREEYNREGRLPAENNLISNHQISVLMVPPEHRAKIQPIMEKIQSIKVPL